MAQRVVYRRKKDRTSVKGIKVRKVTTTTKKTETNKKKKKKPFVHKGIKKAVNK